MGRAPCCDKANVKRGPWSPEEDDTLRSYVERHGSGGNWISLPQKAGLRRCGKSCRLRWLNYLRPNIKHGGFTEEEDHIICTLYEKIGSRWSVIASRLPGRTDNDVKNYWNTKLKKRMIISQNNNLCTAIAAAAAATAHNNIVRSTTPPLPPPPPPPSLPPLVIPTVKVEHYTCDDFMAPPMSNFGLGQADAPAQFLTAAGGVLLEASGFNESVSKYVEDGATTSSSNITAENSNNNGNSYINWSTSECGESYVNGFFPEFGLGSPTELLSGYYANLEKKGEHDANFAPLGNMWVTSETKPKGLYQYS